MIRVEISDANPRTISGTSRRTGNPYSFRVQKGHAHLHGKKYPVEFEFTLADDAPPYPIGEYILAPNSFEVDHNGRLVVARVNLVERPAKAA